MSIYIKGMKIPKVGVYTCELDVLDENTAVLTIYTPIDEPQRSYKLIPIPEGHGRLVDADANFLGVIHLSCGGFVNYNTTIAERLGEEDMRVVKVIVPAEK